MQIVPLKAIPNQTVQIQLGNQPCSIHVYQLDYGLFVDVAVGATQIVAGVIAENLNRIVRSIYLGFIGDFIFGDLQGVSDPVYTGLGTRYLLAYIEESELPSGES